MVQPKYDPKESLERIKLMMKYDTSKTLNENKQFISEQIPEKNADPNILGDQDLLGSTNLIRQYFQSIADFSLPLGVPNPFDVVGANFANVLASRRTGVKGVVDALDGWVDAADLGYVLLTLKSLDGKCYFDDVEGTTVPAINRFLELYSEDEGGDDLESDVESVGTRTLPTGTDKIKRRISALITQLKSKPCVASKDDGKKTDDGKKIKGGGTGGYTPCTGTYKRGCKSEVIKKVQGCLGGLGLDGKFGPNTEKELKSKFPQFATSFTDKDVDTICGKADTATKVDAENPADILAS